ncbi:MAG: flippase [Candidatus Aminicenantes bacterium]|nr:flippase [Candidatus Aminicenantes bacterium]
MNPPQASSVSGSARLIAKGAGVVFLGTAVGSVLRYVFQVIAARGLGAEAFGLWTLGFIIFKIAAMGAEFGLPQGVVRYVAAFRSDGRAAEVRGVVRSGKILALSSGFSAALLALVLAAPVSVIGFHRPETAALIRLFALALPFTTMTTVLLSVTQGYKTMVPTMAVREFFEPLFRLLLVTGMFFLGLRLTGATLAYVVAAAGAMLLAWAAVRRLDPVSAFRAAAAPGGTRLLLSFGWPLFLLQLMAFTIQWTGTILLGIFRSPAEVGVYGAAVKTALLGSLSRNAFYSIFSPIVAEMDSQGRLESMGRTYRTVSKWVFSVNFPLFLGLVIFGRPVLRLFGGEFARGGAPLAMLAVGWVVYSSVGPVGETLIMTGRQRLHLLNMSGGFAANLILSFLLVPYYGAFGAAAAFSISMILYDVAAIIQVRFLVGIRPFPRTLWKPAVAGLLASGIVSVGHLVPALGPMYDKLAAGLAGGAVFAMLYAGFLLLFGLDEEDRRILAQIKSRIVP